MDARSKHEAPVFLQILAGFALLALVMLGAAGTVYKVVSPDGWVAQFFGKGLSAGSAALTALFAIGALAWFSREWASPKQKNRMADLTFYAMAGAGLVYLAQLWTKGSF
jgi:predicted transporter